MGLARRAWIVMMIAGVFGISWASLAALTSHIPLGLQIPSIRDAVAGLIPRGSESVRVIRVIDGDTFVAKVDGHRTRVRILGADTPESVKPGVPVQCYALKASHFAKRLLTGEMVKLTFDVERKDKYGRKLAYVDLHGRDYSLTLLKKGLARPLIIPPNVARAFSYERAAGRAKVAGRGLWGSC